jgi:hypothetical protein
MTEAMRPVIPERLETILLARLATPSKTPPNAMALAKLTRRFAPTTLTEPAWRELVEATLAQLQAQQIVGTDRRLLHKAELHTRIGPHTAKRWEHWADGLLPALALGIRIDDGKARRRLSVADGWVSAIAGRVLGIWHSGPPPSLKLLGDALIWRELGLPGTPEGCPSTLRAHFLKRHIAMKDGTPSQLVRQIASRAVKAPNAAVATVRDALVRHWLAGGDLRDDLVNAAPADATTARAEAAGSATSEPGVERHDVRGLATNGAAREPSSATPDSRSLIDAARVAAQEAHDGLFGDRKVFISSVWSALRQHTMWSALALDDFKRQLVAAHRNQQLVLARADFVSAMDPALVAASETRTDGATFHFIVREPVR